MGSEQVLSALSDVLALTKTMLGKAKQHLWDDITDLEQQRQTIIKAIFPINQNDMSIQIQGEIQKIIDLNHDLETQCREAKQQIQVQMNTLTGNKKAAAAYGSV